MPREQQLAPSAASLTASLRDLGYSLETAIADLIDNSISAGASRIEIFCDLSRAHPVLAIIDNGKGMNQDEILVAMRHGAANPNCQRTPSDLGRFGLGLKTASFSQCRRLTVVSSQEGIRCGAEWDLDRIIQQDDWIIVLFDQTEATEQPFIEHLGDNGTIVIWRVLDRLFEDESGHARDEIVNEKLDLVGKHLALVFHRFMTGEVKGRGKIAISVNGHAIEPFDPFCRKNSATQMLPEEIVRIGESAVHMQPYILPHHSRLSAREYDFYQNRSDFISNQGAYIYRGGRLMAWGDWFRLVPKGEATKLARVQIDFPNNLDEAWTIDIRKSRARPPYAVRERLRQVIVHICGRSTTVHRGRGQKLFEEIKAPLWERYTDHGHIRYAINISHPLVQKLESRLDDDGLVGLKVLVESIAASLPVEMIYSDFSTHPKEVGQASLDKGAVMERLKGLKDVLFGSGETDAGVFREVIRSMRLFDDHANIVEQFIAEESI
jgi:hypothetical protein